MLVRIHGFDWKAYNERIMPALEGWLANDDEHMITKLYMETQRAKAEAQRVTPLQQHRSWLQAQAFVKRLPRGPHAIDEYHILCTPDRFTPLSDRYMYRQPPQLYRTSEALRVIWCTLIEEYCLPWFQVTDEIERFASSTSQAQQEQELVTTKATPTLQIPVQKEQEENLSVAKEAIFRTEMVTLLQSAGLVELAQVIAPDSAETEEGTQSAATSSSSYQQAHQHNDVEHLQEDENDDDEEVKETGILIGQQPAQVRLRGWLASFSIRAMALFELLACGRRCMPFGYEVSDLATGYIGYLTPDEVWQLALCLRKVQSPSSQQVAADIQQFHKHLREQTTTFRMIDEVLPEHADEFISLVRICALQGLGLICSVG